MKPEHELWLELWLDELSRVLSASSPGYATLPNGLPDHLRDESRRRLGAFSLLFNARPARTGGLCPHKIKNPRCRCNASGLALPVRWFDHQSLWKTTSGSYLIVGQPYATRDSGGLSLEGLDDLERHLSSEQLTFELHPNLSWWYPGWTTLVVAGHGLAGGAHAAA